MSVVINAPKSPVTKGSNGIAAATVPNICKMPGPPAPFVPAPLPNIGRSSLSPKGYSKKVKIKKKPVAIKGATFASQGDIASKGTGGGMVSANTHGPTKFVGPGALDVKIEGKNVQLLSDPMLNNCGPSGNPPNAATLLGIIQMGGMVIAVPAGPCPMCGKKDHGELAETEGSKADAGALASAYDSWPPKGGKKTMLGVVVCEHDKKYADMSGSTTERMAGNARRSGAASRAGMTAWFAACEQHTTKNVKAGVRKAAGPLWNERHFKKRLRKAENNINKSDAGGPRALAVGQCAAQGAMLLVINDGALAAAMTEEFYGGSKKASTGAEYLHLAEPKKRKAPKRRKLKSRKFKHGETVPPCKSCEVILPLLLCTGGKRTCVHEGNEGTQS